MMILQKQQLLGNQKLDEHKFCEHCVFSKQHKIKFPKSIHTTKGTLDYIHADYWGPARVPSLGGGRYFLSITDDYSRMSWIYISTPLSEREKLSATINVQAQADQDYMSKVPYSSVVGNLMYVMVCTRPDLAYAVSMVSRLLNQPHKEHWKAVKRIFKYLKGTADVGLVYGSNLDFCLTGYSDVDFAVNLVKRMSLTRYAYTLSGYLVSWKATLQHFVALSTTEVEYMALTEAAKEGIWLRGLINDLGINQEYANIYCDSLSATYLAKD